MNKKTAYLIGMIAAAAAGTVVGMMLAPKKGADLRKDIKEKSHELSDQLKKLAKKGKDKMNMMRDEVEEAAYHQ